MTMAEKLIYHRENKLIECTCRYIDTSHKCQKDFKQIIFVRCTEGCDICKNFLYNKEYNSARWAKDVDGYLICGTCHDKLGCEQICEKCFCKGCYASADEWCDC